MRIIKTYVLVVFCLLFISITLVAQEKLTLQQAIEMALKNNYDINIVKNNAIIAANSNTLGNAGMLPKVDLQASTNLANNATKQEFSLSINRV